MDEKPRYWGCLQAFFVLAITVGFVTVALVVGFWVWLSLNWPSGP